MKRRLSNFNLYKRLFFAILLMTAVYVLARSPVFEVKEVKVVGNNALPVEELVQASGINTGVNIFRLDLKSSAGKVKAIPLIKSAEINRILPDTVEIIVEERQPLALLPVQNGFIQVDEDGVCLQKAELASSNIPVVTGINFKPPVPGERIVSESLKNGLTVIKGFPAGLLPMISEVHVEGEQVVAYTLDGVQCRLGIPGDVQKKGVVFMKVLEELKGKGKKIIYIDLSRADSPVVKYAD